MASKVEGKVLTKGVDQSRTSNEPTQSGLVTAKTIRSTFSMADIEAIKRELDDLTDELEPDDG